MANITAIDIAFRVQKEQREATPLEIRQLREYSGFGGIRSVLYDPKFPDSWPKYKRDKLEYVQLLWDTIATHVEDKARQKQIMDSIKQSTNTAFYTPDNFIRAVGEGIVSATGQLPRNLLEPSAGHGRFLHLFDTLPGAQDIRTVAYEKDYITGLVLSALHSKTETHIQGFENFPAEQEGTFDMAVSNIPFGNVRIFDTKMSKSGDAARRQATHALHNYFFVKGLDAVRNGGLVVFLTSRGVAEADTNRPIREYLVNHANLVSGIRLPDDMFENDGIDKVGTDLLIFQRNDNKQQLSEEENHFIETNDWVFNENKYNKDEKRLVIDVTKTQARNAYFNEDAKQNYMFMEKWTEWDKEEMAHKHTIGLCNGEEHDRFGNPSVSWAWNGMSSEYWDMTIEEELKMILTRDFARNYDRVLAMQATEQKVEVLETGNINDDSLQFLEYPVYQPEKDAYTAHLKDGALVMMQGKPGFIQRLEVEGRQVDCFVPRTTLVENEAEYAAAYVRVRDAYYRLADTEMKTQTEQPELRKALNEAFPLYHEQWERYSGWQNNGINVSATVNNDLKEYADTIADSWNIRSRDERIKNPELPPYILGELYTKPVGIRPSVQNSPAKAAEAEEVMSLYDLFGFTEEERTQIKTTGRKGRKKEANTGITAATGRGQVITQPDLMTTGRQQDNSHVQPIPAVKPFPWRDEEPDERRRDCYDKHYQAGTLMFLDGTAGHYNYDNGQPVFRPLPADTPQETHDIVRLYTGMRDAYWMLFDYESEQQTEWPEQRNIMNACYDEMVQKYGGLREEKVAAVAAMDTQYTEVAVLERYVDGVRTKADIFNGPVAFARQQDEVLSVSDAMNISLDRKGRVDISYIAQLAAVDEREAVDQLQGQIFWNPMENSWEEKNRMMAGNIYHKIDKVSYCLETAKEAYQQNPDPIAERDIRQIESTLEALKRVIPPQIPFEELDFNLGERWIPTDIYCRFVDELFFLEPENDGTPQSEITYVPSRDTFNIYTPWSSKANEAWALKEGWRTRLEPKDVLLYAMEDRLPELTKEVEVRRGSRYYYEKVPDNEAIQQVKMKVDSMKEKFIEFLEKMPVEQKDELADLYNRRFNHSVRPHYDGSFQTFPGLSFNNFEYNDLYPSQKDAIWMIKQNGGGICDHQVGAGKTMIMCVAAHELKRLGLANKPMIIGLKANVHEIAATYRKAYPDAKVLYPGKEDFKPANRKAMLDDIKNNNYDCIILTHEQFEKIPQSPEVQMHIMERELQDVEENLEVLRKQGYKISGRMISGLEKSKENLTVKMRELMLEINSRTDDVCDFRTMGIDHLFVDECHNFKNLKIQTRHKRVAGLGNTVGSQRATGLLTAIRDIQERTGRDLGATFLSGTTISNSLTELYVLFKYLRPKELERQNIRSFDAWAAVFTRKSTEFEFNVTNTIASKERFRYFVKVPELAQFYNQITDYRTAEMIGIDRPTKNAVFNNIPPNDMQNEYIQRLMSFAQSGDMTLLGRDNDDNRAKMAKMLIATNMSSKMSLDMRLIDPIMYQAMEGGKVDRAADSIADYYRRYNHVKGTQFVFSDLGTFKPGEWNVYSAIKDRLVEVHGIPEEEIQFIQKHNTDKKREKLFKDMNEGKVRVLFGSTQALGTGVNAQQRAVAVHHLDTPWRPSDLEQREGRAVRKGNVIAKQYADNKVDVITYATERSLDAYKFNLLQNKQNFISQLKSNQLGSRSLDEGAMDEATGVSFAEYVAVLSGNTDLLDKAKLDKQINQLEQERVLFTRETLSLERRIYDYNGKIQNLQDRQKDAGADWNAWKGQENPIFRDRDGNVIENKEVGRYITRNRLAMRVGTDRIIGDYGGMEVQLSKGMNADLAAVVYLKGAVSDRLWTNKNEAFPAAFSAAEKWLKDLADGLKGRIANFQELIDDYKIKIQEINELINNRNWPKEEELKQLKKESERLEEKIKAELEEQNKKNKKGDVAIEEEDSKSEKVDGEKYDSVSNKKPETEQRVSADSREFQTDRRGHIEMSLQLASKINDMAQLYQMKSISNDIRAARVTRREEGVFIVKAMVEDEFRFAILPPESYLAYAMDKVNERQVANWFLSDGNSYIAMGVSMDKVEQIVQNFKDNTPQEMMDLCEAYYNMPEDKRIHR